MDLPIYVPKENFYSHRQIVPAPTVEQTVTVTEDPSRLSLPYPAHVSFLSDGGKDDEDESRNGEVTNLFERRVSTPYSTISPEENIPPNTAAAAPLPSALSSNRKRVLIVDDSSMNRSVVVVML